MLQVSTHQYHNIIRSCYRAGVGIGRVKEVLQHSSVTKIFLRSEIEIFFVRDAAIIKALYNGA
jgi:hypothetical protein